MPPDPAPEQRHGRHIPIIFGVLTLGVAARTMHYFAGRSLWLDEAMLALNIGERSFAGLLDPLAFNQAAPVGFLWMEKLAVTLLGVSEMALRFFPLSAAIVALFLFAVLARRLLSPWAALVAVLLFSLSTSQVYFAAEVKQYSFDVLWTTVILLLAHHAGTGAAVTPGIGRPGIGPAGVAPAGVAPARRPARDNRLGALAVVGTIGIWFSHPLIFTLPAALAYVVLERRRAGTPSGQTRSRRTTGRTTSGRTTSGRGSYRDPLLVAAAWGVSFALAYFLTASETSRGGLMQRFWVEGFMPFPPRNADEWAWFGRAFGELIRNTYDFTERAGATRAVADVLGGAFLLTGVAFLGRSRRRVLMLLGAPIALALLAAALSLYPFRGRLIQFLVPPSILLMVFGIEGIRSMGPRGAARWKVAVARTSSAGAVALCILISVVLAGWLRWPFREESRPVLQYVAERGRAEDVLFLHSGARHAFEYYNRYCESCRPSVSAIHRGRMYGPEGGAQLEEDVGALDRGSRVWAVFAHEWWTWGAAEKRAILARLERERREIDRVVVPGASAYLFDLADR